MSGQTKKWVEDWYEGFLGTGQIDETFWFENKNQLGIHWANSPEGRVWVREWVKTPQGKIAYQELEDKLESLKQTTIWLSRNRDFIKCNLYELYQFYLDPRIRTTWMQGSVKTMVSFMSEAGPFVELRSLRWLDRDILKNFFLLKLINSQAQERDCRFSTNLKIEAQQEDYDIKSYELSVHQVSQKGILLKVEGSHVFEKLMRGKNWTILSNKKLGQYDCFNGRVHFKFSQPSFGGSLDQHFLFMNYQQFENADKLKTIVHTIEEWTKYSKQLIKKAA